MKEQHPHVNQMKQAAELGVPVARVNQPSTTTTQPPKQEPTNPRKPKGKTKHFSNIRCL
jgi:hypothetical protein